MKNLKSDIREFIHQELNPLEPLLMHQNFKDLYPKISEARKLAKKKNLWLPALDKKWGGLGLSLTEFAAISEELGYSPFGHLALNVQAPDIGNMEILNHFGSDVQQQKFLKPLAAGEIRSCFGMTEPEHAGSNPVMLSTMGERKGNSWVLNGHKWFTTAFDGASFCIVMAITNPDAEKHKRASMFIVPVETPELEHIRNIPIMGEAGSGYFSHAEIRLQNCEVPHENLLGGEGNGFVIAQQRLGPGRIHHCMRWIGVCERAMEMMCRYAQDRELKPGLPLSSQQTIQHAVAELRIGIDAARALILKTAEKIDKAGSKSARNEISMIKVLAARTLLQTLDQAIQIHGGLGITDDTLLSFWYRHERGARIYDGPDEVHKNVIAREEFRKYQ